MPGLAAWSKRSDDGAPQLAFCWAHARRKFYDIHVATQSPIAEEALQRIAALYAIEADIRGQTGRGAPTVRQQRSRPLVEAMHVWLTETLGPHLRPIRPGPGDPLCAQPLERIDPVPRRRPPGAGYQHGRARHAPGRNARFIVHLLFKYLETLEVDLRWRCDTGALYAQPPPPRTACPGRRRGSGTAHRERPARREGCRP